MAIRKGHYFSTRDGFTGSAGQIPVRGYMRSAPKVENKPQSGQFALMRTEMAERKAHRPNMNRGGSFNKRNY